MVRTNYTIYDIPTRRPSHTLLVTLPFFWPRSRVTCSQIRMYSPRKKKFTLITSPAAAAATAQQMGPWLTRQDPEQELSKRPTLLLASGSDAPIYASAYGAGDFILGGWGHGGAAASCTGEKDGRIEVVVLYCTVGKWPVRALRGEGVAVAGKEVEHEREGVDEIWVIGLFERGWTCMI